MKVSFVVEQAGCESCAKLVRSALSELGTVESVAVDSAADTALVVLASGEQPNRAAVDGALAAAAPEGGHDYRVQPGSWRTV